MNKRMRGTITARIEGKRVVIPYNKTFLSYGESRKPLMVSNVPGEKGKALMWVKVKGKGENQVYAIEFDVKTKTLKPTSSVIANYVENEKINYVPHLRVDPSRRGKGIGAAAAAFLISEALRKGKKEVTFPIAPGHPNEFYKKFGANELNEVDLGKLSEKSIEWPDVLKRKGFKIYWTAGKLNK